ncbi:PREDICTED: uncharacterized protein LOC105139864 [Populus euphratica]|uniref:Uncharacterized protein LOC105139862 n=1 Tax=Populus euphratica TaxID=75702 RepID=A0AAJ6VC90_POPEU|nr:PREDICTED: uncharacterized protein LOC105139862 [Populus euphratica]XP_011044791.1 PREDICTED: uncharacterized protein LOC105139864 [Populus euphratica]
MSKISLEDYLHFFLSHKQFGLSPNFLNQIIRMHGFKKIVKVSQKVLIDAVDKIDLENLSRSTVKEKNEISSCTLMNMKDIVADMKTLNWQECRVTSIQSLNAKSDLQVVAGGGGKRKRKRGSSSARGAAAIDALSTTTAHV